MPLLDDWRSKIAKVAKTVKDSSGELYKTSKINLTLGSEQENLKKLYLEIGKKVHEIYQYGGSLGKFFDEKYEEIREVEGKIEELKKQLEELKQVKICPKCMKEVEHKAVFCPSCGASMRGEVSRSKEEQEIEKELMLQEETREVLQQEASSDIELDQKEKSEQEEKQVKICPTCKTENSPEDKFCMSCGRAIF